LYRKSTVDPANPPCAALQPIWEQLDECDRDAIWKAVTLKRFSAGQTLYLQGDDSPGIYCIESGLIGLRRSDEKGNSALLRLAKTGDMLGYRSVRQACPQHNTAEVLADAKVSSIESGKIRWLISRSRVLHDHLFQKALQDLDRTEACCAELLTSGLKERLLNLLLDLHDTCVDRHQVDQSRFELPIQKKDIAALLGTSPAALSRVISLLERDGDVSLKGRQISITKHVGDQRMMAEDRYVA